MARRRGSLAGSGSQVLGAVGRWCRVVRWGRAVQRCYIDVHVRPLACRSGSFFSFFSLPLFLPLFFNSRGDGVGKP